MEKGIKNGITGILVNNITINIPPKIFLKGYFYLN